MVEPGEGHGACGLQLRGRSPVVGEAVQDGDCHSARPSCCMPEIIDVLGCVVSFPGSSGMVVAAEEERHEAGTKTACIRMTRL